MKNSFPRDSRSRHSLFVFIALALLIGVITLSDLPAQTQNSQSLLSSVTASAPGVIGTSPRATDVLLSLAQAVGESEPARRLVSYALQKDPSGTHRFWAIVDFDQPSTNKRLYVFDTVAGRVDTYYVAHGRGSEGRSDDGMAEVFSNLPSSNSSSLGIYKALDEYVGNHGRSMRLEGLEPTNSNALSRAVVLHKAPYATEDFIRSTGRLGRSEGCFAVDPAVSDTLINELENGAYILAWKRNGDSSQTTAP